MGPMEGSVEAGDRRALRLGLWLLPGISSAAIRRAQEVGFGDGDREALAGALGVGQAARRHLLAAPDLSTLAADEVRRLAARDGWIALRGDPPYPTAFEELRDPPEAIEVRGSLPRGRAVAVVGSRQAPTSARALARETGALLARAGFAVISGGALGIDAAAHRGALDAGGSSWAVLGSGVLRPYPPRHRPLFAELIETGGGLLSELPGEAGGRAEHFPRRNRLIAALAEAVLVIAAGHGSGSLYTAEAARKLGRRLLVAHGGSEAPGCAGLIAAGAEELCSPAEILAALGVTGDPSGAGASAASDTALLRVLRVVPMPLAALATDAGLEVAEAARILARLCGRSLARPAGPGRFALP